MNLKVKAFYKLYFIFLISFVVTLLVLFLLIWYPLLDNYIYKGNETVNNFIEKNLGNNSNDEYVVPIILQWMKDNIHYPTDEERIFWNFYSINNKTKLFYRGSPASWIIKTKIGRCEEFSLFFVEIMDRLGYRARSVRMNGWDHAWAEYYTKEGYKILVDTSGNKLIKSPIEWIGDKNITKVYATDINGKKEEVTKEYMPPTP